MLSRTYRTSARTEVEPGSPTTAAVAEVDDADDDLGSRHRPTLLTHLVAASAQLDEATATRTTAPQRRSATSRAHLHARCCPSPRRGRTSSEGASSRSRTAPSARRAQAMRTGLLMSEPLYLRASGGPCGAKYGPGDVCAASSALESGGAGPAASVVVVGGRAWVQADALEVHPAVLVDERSAVDRADKQGGRGGEREREQSEEPHVDRAQQSHREARWDEQNSSSQRGLPGPSPRFIEIERGPRARAVNMLSLSQPESCRTDCRRVRTRRLSEGGWRPSRSGNAWTEAGQA